MLQVQRPYLEEVDFEDDAPSSIGDDSMPEADLYEASPSLDDTPGAKLSRTDTMYFDASRPRLLPACLTMLCTKPEAPNCLQVAYSGLLQMQPALR